MKSFYLSIFVFMFLVGCSADSESGSYSSVDTTPVNETAATAETGTEGTETGTTGTETGTEGTETGTTGTETGTEGTETGTTGTETGTTGTETGTTGTTGGEEQGESVPTPPTELFNF